MFPMWEMLSMESVLSEYRNILNPGSDIRTITTNTNLIIDHIERLMDDAENEINRIADEEKDAVHLIDSMSFDIMAFLSSVISFSQVLIMDSRMCLLSVTSASILEKSVLCSSLRLLMTVAMYLSSSFMENGLNMHPSKPASSNVFLSLSLRTVIATTGMSLELPIRDLRSSFNSSNPLASGIWMSVSSRS